VIISYGDGKKKARLDEMIRLKLERIVFSVTSESSVSQFTFVCNNVVEAEEIEEWIQSLDGVARAWMGVIREFILASAWLDDERKGDAFRGQITKDSPELSSGGFHFAVGQECRELGLGRPNTP
jgi:hypothetical protein